jgi:hypothetical protein
VKAVVLQKLSAAQRKGTRLVGRVPFFAVSPPHPRRNSALAGIVERWHHRRMTDMTAAEIAKVARQSAGMILDRLPPDAVATIPLSSYPTEGDYTALRGKLEIAGWTFEQWQAVNLAVVERLREAGIVVVFVECKADAVFGWLAQHGLENTPANRAQYVSAKTTGFRAEPLGD